MAETLSIDFETRSTVDLRRTGVYPYAEDKTTDILCMAYAFDDEEPRLWVPKERRQGETDEEGIDLIAEHVRAGLPLRAWNANFERVIWCLILGPRYGFPVPTREQWFCTAAEAAALALPRGLGDCAQVLGVDFQKDVEGHRLMMQLCKPRSRKKGKIVWWDDPEKYERLYEYCRQDVRTERAVAGKLRRLGKQERRIFLLDQEINDRGVLIDVPLVKAAQKIVDEGTERANREIEEMTNGEVAGVTKIADLTRWLQVHIPELENVQKATLRDVLEEEELDPEVERVITLRQEAGKSSTAKLTSMLEYACACDGRARGMLLYHGASTGRWSGRGPQPQNYPRPTVDDVERFIPWVMAGDYDRIEQEAPALVVISSLLRSMLIAAPGHRLMAGDFAQIEARVLAWIAEQDDLVHLFATGGKVYEEMASAIYGVPVEDIGKDSPERQVGKMAVLGAGFQMGADTFATQTKRMTGIELDRGEWVMRCRGQDGSKHQPGAYALKEGPNGSPFCVTCGSSAQVYKHWIRPDMAQKAISAYRDRNGRIRQFWYDIDRAAIQAVANPGEVTSVGRDGKIRYVVRGQFLWCILPSGRVLAYAKPDVRPHLVEPKEGAPFTTTSVTFMGVDSRTRKWKRQFGYGGFFTENVVQAMSRDLMAEALVRLADAGYRPVLTVHDEVLGEPEEGHGSLDEFLEIMKTRPRWASGLPVAAEGWVGERYRK